MKGIVFTELIEMVEEGHGLEAVDEILSIPELSSKGIFTATGTYPVKDIELILSKLTELTGADRDALLHLFGGHLFNTFTKNYSELISGLDNTFDLLRNIENHIHVEVKKLYPEAELPKFEVKTSTDDVLELVYRSSRYMGSLALGLMEATASHFEEEIEIISTAFENGDATLFTLTKK